MCTVNHSISLRLQQSLTQCFLSLFDVCSVDKASNFKSKDYEFMRCLRSDNSENREQMTIKLTQKLLENQRRGKNQNVADVARKISHKMARTVHGTESYGHSKQSSAVMTDGEEEEAAEK